MHKRGKSYHDTILRFQRTSRLRSLTKRPVSEGQLSRVEYRKPKRNSLVNSSTENNWDHCIIPMSREHNEETKECTHKRCQPQINKSILSILDSPLAPHCFLIKWILHTTLLITVCTILLLLFLNHYHNQTKTIFFQAHSIEFGKMVRVIRCIYRSKPECHSDIWWIIISELTNDNTWIEVSNWVLQEVNEVRIQDWRMHNTSGRRNQLPKRVLNQKMHQKISSDFDRIT